MVGVQFEYYTISSMIATLCSGSPESFRVPLP